MLSVTYGYARVSKADDAARNLETQLGILADHGIREDLMFSDVASGRTMNRTGWVDLMSRVQLNTYLFVPGGGRTIPGIQSSSHSSTGSLGTSRRACGFRRS